MSKPMLDQTGGSGVRRDVVLLLVACLGLWGWTCGLWDLWGPDETRYVEVGRELLERPLSQWMLLTANHEPYDQKPPLTFWMFAGLIKLGGGAIHSWLLRLPSVLMGTLTVLLTYDLGRRRLGRSVGLLAGMMMLTAPMFLEEVPSTRLDVLLSGWITLALWAVLAREPEAPLPVSRVFPFWLGVTCGFFIKGPVVLLIVLSPLVWMSWRGRSWAPWKEIKALWGFPVFLALVGGWLYAQKQLAPQGFVEGQIESAAINRLVQTDQHVQPIFYYLLNIVGDGFLPWGLLLFASLWQLWRERKSGSAPMGAMAPLLAWSLFPLLVISIIPGKREQYLLPLFPAMAVLAAWYGERRLAVKPGLPRYFGVFMAVILGLAGVVLTGFAGIMIAKPELHPRLELNLGPVTQGIWLVLGVGLLVAATQTRRIRSWRGVMLFSAGVVYLGALTMYATYFPAKNEFESSRPLAEAIERELKAGEKLVGAMGGAHSPELQVYGDYRLVPVNPDAGLFGGASAVPRVLLVEPRDLKVVQGSLDARGYRKTYDASRSLHRVMIYVRDAGAGK